MFNKVSRRLLWVTCGMVALTQSALPIKAEVFYETLYSEGWERRFILDLPDDAQRGKLLPTVVVLHAALMNGGSMRKAFGMDAIAKQDKIAVAYPDALRGTWQDGGSVWRAESLRDVHFLQELARHLIRQGVADPKRLYLVGFSAGGGMLTYRVTCYAPDAFAAYAVILASMPKHTATKCPRDHDVPILIVSATDDKFVPWEGGVVGLTGIFGTVLSTDETVAFWRRRNGCSKQANIGALPDKDQQDGSRVLAFQYVDCQTKSPVVFLKIQGGGHQLPGANKGPILDSILGKANQDISAADISWRFFQNFPLND